MHPSVGGVMSPPDQARFWQELRRAGRKSPFRCGQCGRKLKPAVADDRVVFECHPKRCQFRRVLTRGALGARVANARRAAVTEVVID
jgi:hypothetical protein